MLVQTAAVLPPTGIPLPDTRLPPSNPTHRAVATQVSSVQGRIVGGHKGNPDRFLAQCRDLKVGDSIALQKELLLIIS